MCSERKGRMTKLSNPPLDDRGLRVWIVEKEGRQFARIEDARFVDMFWVSYRVIDLTKTEADRRFLFSAPFWLEAPLPTFRHVPSGFVCNTAFAGTGVLPTPENPLVIMRRLIPPERKPGWFRRLRNWALGAN